MGMLSRIAREAKLNLENNTYYRFQLEEVKVSNKVNPDDPFRRFLILNFMVVANPDNPAHDEFIGMKPNNVMIAYWPELTEDEYSSWSEKQKDTFKKATKNFMDLARGLGFSEADLEEIEVEHFENKVGVEVMCRVYQNKGTDYLDISNMTPIVDI